MGKHIYYNNTLVIQQDANTIGLTQLASMELVPSFILASYGVISNIASASRCL